MQYRIARRFGRVLILLFAGAAGCGGDNLTAPATNGTLEITTSTTGTEMDPDGYTVQVDAEGARPIGSAATLQHSDLTPGNHTVQLAGLAANCTVTGENPRTVSVTAGQTMTVTFAVTCQPTTGGLRINTNTLGPSPDADGYSITVDGVDRGTIGASAGSNLDGITAGQHEIGLSGVAANCTVDGANPQTVAVTAGSSATVTFTVTCAAPPADVGSLKITTATTGADPDANGYRVAVDAGATQPIGVNAASTIANVAAGNHSVRLSGLTGNCTVQGANPRSINVAGGATAEVSFAVSCSATTGSVEIRTATTGSNLDPDGYAVSVDGAAAQSIGVNSTLPIAGVPAGAHQVALTGMALNCSVQGDNPRQVTVTAGASVTTTFDVQCTSTTGSQWTVMPSGTDFNLSAISGKADDDILAVGYKSPGPTPEIESVILHFDGAGDWRNIYHRTDLKLNAVWGGPRKVFAAGESIEQGATLVYFDGVNWVETVVPEVAVLNAMWGSSDSDVFAVGSDAILHYDGSAWSRMTVPTIPDLRLTGISGNSPQNVYAVGWSGDRSSAVRHVLHFDGVSWTSVYQAPSNDLLQAVWTSAEGRVIAVATGEGLHYDGSSWSTKPLPSTTFTLFGVWGASATDVYGVGTGVIYHFDGTSWTDTNAPRVTRLLGVWGSSAADVYAVGEGGVILHGP